MGGRVCIMEFMRGKSHGSSQVYDKVSGRRIDSSFYQAGQLEGVALVWDSLGNVVNRAEYHKDKPVGKSVRFFPGLKPAQFQNYDRRGREQGLQEEWWPNGNKKNELMAKNGEIISGTEYYVTGKPRIRYATKYDPGGSLMAMKTISQESWAPDGRSAGTVVKGQGETLLFGNEASEIHVAAHREVYKDSLLVKLDELDSAETLNWLDAYSKAHPSR